jgi:hypothetical protein
MEQIQAFFNDPAIVGIWGVLVVALVDFGLGVYQSIRAGVFDWQKLPQVLDTVVLQKVIPLALLGIAAFFVTEPTQKQVLLLAYGGFALATLTALVNSLIKKVTGKEPPTNLAMDRNMVARSQR